MTSSPTTRNRLLKQGTGDNTNTWGEQQSSGDFDMIDVALDGVLPLTVTGPLALTTANYVDDQARRRVLKILAASTAAATVTLPAVEKWYLVWNASAYDQTFASQGGGASCVVKAGEIVFVVCDGIEVHRLSLVDMNSNRLQNVGAPTANSDAATKAYVDAQAFAALAGELPGQAGSSGKFLTTNGSAASWAAPTVSQISDYASDQAAKIAVAIAFCIAL
jgi:hypothetical protein